MSERTEYRHGEFCWVDLVAHNMQEIQPFYESLLGWTTQMMDTQGGPPYAGFHLNGKGVAGLGEMPADMKSAGVPPMWNSYINVDDIEAVTQKAVEFGGKITMPVYPVLDAGTLAFIQDPTGGNVGLWQRNQHFGAEVVNTPGAFCWNELGTRDLDGAKDFYTKLFGWTYSINESSPSEYYIIENQGQMNGGMLKMTEEWGEMPPYWGVYFTVSDMKETVQTVEKLGGKICCAPFNTPVGQMCVITDPQGAALNLIQLNEQG